MTTTKYATRLNHFVERLYKSCLRTKHVQVQRYSSSATTREESSPIKLVIFDKDGTLTCFHTMWGPWCEAVANKLRVRTGVELTRDVYRFFNYDPTTGKIGKGSLAEQTHEFLQTNMADMLNGHHEISRPEAEVVVTDTWNDTLMTSYPTVKPVCDVEAIFCALTSSNIKIAICTSDDRANTLKALDALKVDHMVDYILCGNDPQNTPKPSPDNVHLICSELGIDRKNTAVVGDTPADTQMGRMSDVGMVFGVLSGVCSEADLRPDADFVVKSINEALPVILNSHYVKQTRQS